MSTEKNLKDAFAGESQANRKYLAFAKKAESEGYARISKLFNAIAEAETIHALKHLQVLGAVKSTAENVNAAIEGETYEFKEMYPQFLNEAQAEGAKTAFVSFNFANEAEKVHGALLTEAAKALESSQDFPAESFFLCPICGYVEADHAPEKCPICSTPGKSFKQF